MNVRRPGIARAQLQRRVVLLCFALTAGTVSCSHASSSATNTTADPLRARAVPLFSRVALDGTRVSARIATLRPNPPCPRSVLYLTIGDEQYTVFLGEAQAWPIVVDRRGSHWTVVRTQSPIREVRWYTNDKRADRMRPVRTIAVLAYHQQPVSGSRPAGRPGGGEPIPTVEGLDASANVIASTPDIDPKLGNSCPATSGTQEVPTIGATRPNG